MNEEVQVIPAVCKRYCSVCEGMDHHWMPGMANEDEDGDTVDGEMVMVCKHCDAVREIEEDEDRAAINVRSKHDWAERSITTYEKRLMLAAIPVAEFMDPPKGSRPWKALDRALQLKPDVQLIGVWQGEKYFRVQGRGGNRYCVILWLECGEPMAQCTCEAFYIPHDPTHCFHVGAVLIYEATQEAPKVASMGRNQQSLRRDDAQAEI